MSDRHVVMLAAAIAMLFLAAAPAAAQPSADDEAQARVYFEAARLHYDQGRFVQAAEEFSRAYELSQNPVLLYNVFLANRDAGRIEDATEALEGYLAQVSDPPNRPALEARLETMRAQLRERQESEESTRETPDAETEAIESPEDVERSAPVGAFTTMGVGGGLLVGAVVTGVLARRAESDLDAACPGRVNCDPQFESTRDRMRRLGVITDVLWTTGAAAAVSGLVWLLVRRSRREAPPEPSFGFNCAPGRCDLSYRGAF